MQIECVTINRDGSTKPADVLDCGTHIAEFRDYINPTTKKPDPQLFFKPNRWIHVTTLHRHKPDVVMRDVETGDTVEVENLSEY